MDRLQWKQRGWIQAFGAVGVWTGSTGNTGVLLLPPLEALHSGSLATPTPVFPLEFVSPFNPFSLASFVNQLRFRLDPKTYPPSVPYRGRAPLLSQDNSHSEAPSSGITGRSGVGPQGSNYGQAYCGGRPTKDAMSATGEPRPRANTSVRARNTTRMASSHAVDETRYDSAGKTA